MNLLFHTADHAGHDPTVADPGHPERPARLDTVAPALEAAENRGWVRRPHPPAGDEALLRLHPASHLAWLEQLAAAGGGRVEADTCVTPNSVTVARGAVGAALAAVDAVLTEDDTNRAFCAVRPPGHHARPFEDRGAMGFCLFANAALAAAHARATHGLDRVLVVDFDVHHGNGTQDLMWDEARCLFASTHQMPLYPGS
ncbi:MAG: histone deacetylase family protein, partial [Planctomycetota bacterium]